MTINKRLYIFSLIVFTLFSCNKKKHIVSASSNSVHRNPNIIYILADDLGYGDLTLNGQKKFETPNIDKLAAEGIVFTQHYSGATVCAPSRSALLTGMHTGHTVVRGNKEIQPEGQYPIPSDTYTVAEMLKEVGYKTSVFGKWGLGFPGSEGDANMQGFDEFFGYNCQRLAHNYYPHHLWHNQEKIILDENVNEKQGIYAPDMIHEKSLEFLEQNKDSTFFMLYATPLPHAELLIPEKYMEKYRGDLLPELNFKGVDEGPTFKKGGYGSQKESHAAFAAIINHLDNQVGEIMKKLEELGIAENTIVIFTSDNGPHREGGADPDYFDSNGIYKGYKRDLYEGGVHVPMIARWPQKIKAGSSTNHISAFWDVMPTFAEIIGKNLDENIDGISFLPTLTNQGKQAQHEYLYWEFHEKGGRIAIRKGKWKGVKYNVLKKPKQTIELYDLKADPGETENLASLHPEIVAELTALMQEARTPSDIFQFAAPTYLDSK
ncbi:arylsulfatase [Lutimonas saemankumensis]|uniref:arylsulfatase n=1 Tax=Lutimonas saemankumensis TaxID=483016 RepID=UPI001CD763A4|nr:arylsulfatase [Lutimonas saemankumensis]MCA0932472.1 arylsulfatase [Lutimonas saemankumensis]